MSHNIFGERVVLSKEPAWHRLGQVFQEPVSAREAHDSMTPPIITLEPVFTKLPSLTDKARRPANFGLNQQVIIRHPVPDDPEYKTFGMVGPEYVLVPPIDFADIWDDATQLPLESAAFLGKGETFFVSSRLPTLSVKGDEVQMFLLGVSHYTGGRANELIISPVRTVCQNTLMLARAEARESYAVDHDARVHERLSKWLKLMVGGLEIKTTMLQEQMDHLAGIRIEDSVLAFVLKDVYPDPKPIRQTPDPAENEKREADREFYVRAANRSRSAVKELFEGAGTGLGEGPLQGTAWFLYNAVTEYENYRRTTDNSSASRDVLFGARAQVMSKAFDTLMSVK